MSEIERVLRTRATDPHELYPITDKEGITARIDRARSTWNAAATDMGGIAWLSKAQVEHATGMEWIENRNVPSMFLRDDKAWPMTGQQALTGLYLDSEPPKVSKWRAFLARANAWLGSHE